MYKGYLRLPIFIKKKASMTIAPATLQFLRDLAAHNDRDWFAEHKPRYETAWKNMKKFVAAVEAEMSKFDVLEGSKLFRIYRDVRFSKDKLPYKSNLSAGFKRATAKRRGGFYLHIQPGESFVGGGFWEPNPADLKRIRDEFAADAGPIRKIIAGKEFQKYFGELQGDEVKTAPKGFSKEDPNIDLIRKKQFVVSRKFSDAEVLKTDFASEVAQTFQAMLPYFDYMTGVLTTNLDGESLVD